MLAVVEQSYIGQYFEHTLKTADETIDQFTEALKKDGETISRLSEFDNFISENKNKSPQEFCQYWNTVEYKKYKFYLYNQIDKNSPISWPDNASASEIFSQKIINCYRINILLKELFPGGELILVFQPTVSYDHYHYKLKTGDIIDNWNDGKYLYIKYKN